MDNIPNPNNSLPILKINLLKLCGYVPKTTQEYDTICNEIKSSLFGKQEQDDINIEFYKRSRELLESNIALHSDTKSDAIECNTKDGETNTRNQWLIVPYPEHITLFSEEDITKPTNIINVPTIWNQILNESSNTTLPTITQRILTHIPNVINQTLCWKYDMIQCIKELSKREEDYKIHTLKERELRLWRTTERKNKINKLYEIRNVFEQRFMETECELQNYIDIREDAVEQKMYDLFGVDLLQDDVVSSSESDSSSIVSISSQEHDDDSITSNDDISNERQEERLKRREKQNQKRSKQQKRQARKKKYKEQQEKKIELNILHTTPNENKLSCLLQSLTNQLNKMDDLLDSLLTEEEEDCMIDDEEAELDSNDTIGFSLLDEILAMILGSQPCENHNLEEIYKEHQTIKEEWLSYFGRLPPSTSLQVSDDTNLKSISQDIDNDEEETITPLKEQQTSIPDCWEDEIDDVVQDLSSTHLDGNKNSGLAKSKKPVVGFRPGGRVV